jgi:hypothetical protein
MTAARVFRALLIVQFLLPIIFRLVGATQGSAPPIASHFAHPNVFRAIALVVIVANIAVTIGLWRFRAWARIGAIILLLIALGFAFSVFHDGFVTRASFALMYTEQFIMGVIFAMMFLPPLSLEFAQRKV